MCEHGRSASCGRVRRDGEQAIGQPLCLECFDYQDAVLFNASAPALWAGFTRALAPALCRELGIARKVRRSHLRLSFGKVIEYQARGLVHVHAVIRADGPGGAGDVPPPWASADLLRTAVLAAAAMPSVTVADPDDPASMLILSWGHQIDAGARESQAPSVRMAEDRAGGEPRDQASDTAHVSVTGT